MSSRIETPIVHVHSLPAPEKMTCDAMKHRLFEHRTMKQSPTPGHYSLLKKIALFTLCIFLLKTMLSSMRVEAKETKGVSRSQVTMQHFGSVTTGSRADWTGGVPQFCKRMIENPVPQEHACKRHPVTFNCLDSGKLIMFSQFKQDFYLFTKHFAHLKRPGVYLDVAANDPFHYSNTYFMDRCLGWKGVCVEGNPSYYEKLYRERSCHIVPTCVGRQDGQHVSFALGGGSGGVVGVTFKNAEMFAKQNKTLATLTEKCTTMRKVLERTNIITADYLSLDVEGHELEVLNGFNWDNIKINVLSVETSPTTREPIEEFMVNHGYKKHHPRLDERSIRSGSIKDDVIFLHEDVVFGKPV